MKDEVSASVCCSCEAVRMRVEKGVSKACLRDRWGGNQSTRFCKVRLTLVNWFPDDLSVKVVPPRGVRAT
ncbi:hypothetical protein GCM10010282_04880 [Streptomyces roseolus]|nr:hypothetical protein GCM10010282_04880 [Streptomyces roseolus]